MTDVRSTTDALGLIKYSRGHPVTDTDLATNMDNIDAGVVARVSTTMVTLDGEGQTPLYTVPVGKVFVPVMVVFRAGANTDEAKATFGQAGEPTDFLVAHDLTSLSAAGDVAIMMPVPSATPAQIVSYVAATVFVINVTATGSSAENDVDLFGYLVDA